MKKRISCLFLSLLLFVTFLPVHSLADEETDPTGLEQEPEQEEILLKTTESMIDFIKSYEGFSPNVVADVGQYAIGYGTSCNPADYPDGITEEEADRLMRKVILTLEESLDKFLTRQNITLSANQYDALISLIFNLGPGIIKADSRIFAILVNGVGKYSNNDIASAIGVYCHVGTTINSQLLSRRIREVQVFLYGDYTGKNSPEFKYLIFDSNGGSTETDVRLYIAGDKYQSLPTASANGYLFGGWYKEDGTRLQASDAVRENHRVKALWTDTHVPDTPLTLSFTDIKSTDWFASYVEDLHGRNVINGYSDHTFRPAASVTTGEMLKLLLLTIGFEAQPKGDEHWAQPYADIALKYGFLSEEDLAGGLNAPATRSIIAKLTARALDLRRNGMASPFADTDDDYVVALYNAHILEGSINPQTGLRMYYPDNPIKRSEIAKIVWMLYEKVRNNA